ncbi:MAG: creatininase family protein [Acidobacteria bacterium]|nr:creatininase family protein [Acidobacteriota bacterium]
MVPNISQRVACAKRKRSPSRHSPIFRRHCRPAGSDCISWFHAFRDCSLAYGTERSRSGDTVIFPTGGIEQNGPHMVLGKHSFRAKYAAEKIAQKLGMTLVAPVLPYAH